MADGFPGHHGPVVAAEFVGPANSRVRSDDSSVIADRVLEVLVPLRGDLRTPIPSLPRRSAEYAQGREAQLASWRAASMSSRSQRSNRPCLTASMRMRVFEIPNHASMEPLYGGHCGGDKSEVTPHRSRSVVKILAMNVLPLSLLSTRGGPYVVNRWSSPTERSWRRRAETA